MQEPLHNRTFDKLRTVVSTEWDQPQYHGVLNFRALVVEQYFPDLVGEMSRRLQEESETILLRSYAYSEGKLWKVWDWRVEVTTTPRMTPEEGLSDRARIWVRNSWVNMEID